MISVDEIAKPVLAEFIEVKELLKGALISRHRELNEVAGHLISSRGKLLRPIVTLLAARLCSEQVTAKTINMAATVELVHSATLTHDDVIDEAYTRHNQLTLSTLMRSRSAVLIGDFMFSRGLSLASRVKAYDELDIVINAIESLVEGELRQSQNVRRLKVTEQEYFEVVELKTSSLIAAAAEVGVVSVGGSDEQRADMREFALAVGAAFQIQDDILDYMPKSHSGKTPYNDIKERKITLPLIAAISVGGERILKDLRAGRVQRIVDFVEMHNGVLLAEQIMDRIIVSAVEKIMKYPKSDIRDSLIAIAHFAANRNK